MYQVLDDTYGGVGGVFLHDANLVFHKLYN